MPPRPGPFLSSRLHPRDCFNFFRKPGLPDRMDVWERLTKLARARPDGGSRSLHRGSYANHGRTLRHQQSEPFVLLDCPWQIGETSHYVVAFGIMRPALTS